MFSDSRQGRNIRALLWILLLGAGIAAWGHEMSGLRTPRLWRALLINFLFFTPLSAALVVWSAILQSSKARWARGVERIAAAGISFAIPSLTALAVLWAGSGEWAPWHGKELHQGKWLYPNILFGRQMAGLALFWGASLWYLRARRKGKAAVPAGILIVLFAIVFSMIGFDLVMGLDPHWYSSLFGGFFFISTLYIGVAAWAFIASWTNGADNAQLQDLGNLIIAFGLLTTSFMYAQLLTIWYENMPEETRYLIPRMNYPPWSAVSLVVVLLVYLGPLVLFLTGKAKRSRPFVGIVSFLLLAGMWIERWWLVAPTFSPSLELGMEELSLAAAFVGALGLGIDLMLRRIPELPQIAEDH